MKCSCIEDIEKKFIGLEYGDKKRKVIKASIPVGFTINNNSMDTITSTQIELEVEGMSRRQKQQLVHSYCPFCGTAIKPKSSEI